MNLVNEKAAQGDQEIYDIDFIPQLRHEHLNQMLLGTLGAVVVFSAFIAFPSLSVLGSWIIYPIVIILISAATARYLLLRRDLYDSAAQLYVSGLLISLIPILWFGPSYSSVFRYATPFALTLISSLAGLLLSPNVALAFTLIGMVGMGVFAITHAPNAYDWVALMMAVVSAVIANTTAGGLYTMAQHSTRSYLRARERADEFWRNKEALRKALATQDWLNQRLTESNHALEKRAIQLQISSEVGQQATSILDLELLLPKVVELIQARFGYYFVGIWLYSERDEALVLSAGLRRGGDPLEGSRLMLDRDQPSIAMSVWQSGEHRIVNDVREAPDFLHIETLFSTQSLLVLPIHLAGRISGVLDIQSDELWAFTDDDRMVFQGLADQISISIRNAQLYASEQTGRQLAETLEKTGRALSSSLNLQEVTGRILEQLDIVVPFERGSVLIERGDVLCIVAQRGFPEGTAMKEFDIPIREGDVFQKIVSSHRSVVISDVLEDRSFQQFDWLPVHRSWLGVPLISKDRVIGMLSLTRRAAGAFSQDDAHLVMAFAGQAAVALENASLYDRITRFNEQLEQMVLERTDELNRAYRTLEKMDKNKSDFINVAAHELRTPLTVIKGYAQVLKSNPVVSNDTQLAPLLAGMVSGTERLHTIVNGMLDVAKIDSHSLKLLRRDLSMAPLFKSLQGDYLAALQERQLTLEVGDLGLLPPIYADPNLLSKAFEQVLDNAIKYTPDGGRISVSGRLVEPGDPSLGIVLPAGARMIQITVNDTGIGINPEYHELIFEKFFQTGEVALHSSGKIKFKGGGPGLGLAIARGIILAHGGRIWVESPGYDEKLLPGSRFHICLPVGVKEKGGDSTPVPEPRSESRSHES